MSANRFSLLAIAFAFTATCLHAQWRPVSPEELALKPPKSDANADAEGLFRDVRLLNEAATFGYPHNVITEYVRLKIFTDRGKEKYSNVEIPYFDKNVISDVQGRTIHPDGTILDVKKDAIFDKVIERKTGQKVRVITFALPAVEPGSIIEYRWTKSVGEFISRYVPLEVQTDFPVDEVDFHIKPVSGTVVSWPTMRYMPFNCNPQKNENEMGGFTGLKVLNVPAFHEEPYMPPPLTSKQWILIYYEENSNSGKEKYWTSLGKEIHGEYAPKLKVNGELKQIAQEVTSGAANDEEKVARLAEYCRKNIKNLFGDEITAEEREAAKKENNNTSDTFHRKEGTPRDINLAFIALAQAAGYDASLAELADRRTFFFNPEVQSRYFLNSSDVAVYVNNKWNFYDIINPNLAPGQLYWSEQGIYALVTDGKQPEFVQTPILSSEVTKIQRIGTLKLSAEGVLEGDIRELLWGNEAITWRERHGKANPEQREEALRDQLKQRFGDFDLSAVKTTASPDLKLPVGINYHIVVRGYAQRTGKRLFLPPNFFAVGHVARFTDSTRTQSVYFDYPWSEFDSLDIQLPEGYQLDHPDAPQGVKVAPTVNYSLQLSISKDNVLHYRRNFTFGTDKLLVFEAKVYPAIKQIFEIVQQGDTHMLTLKHEDQPAQTATQQ